MRGLEQRLRLSVFKNRVAALRTRRFMVPKPGYLWSDRTRPQ